MWNITSNATFIVFLLGLVCFGDLPTNDIRASRVHAETTFTGSAPMLDAGLQRSLAVQSVSSEFTGGSTLDVCQMGCGYDSVQAAINAAAPGDVIRVAQGTYFETLLVNKNVTLNGGYDGPPMWQRSPLVHRTVLDGTNSGSVVRIVNCSPTLDGFVITRGDAGIGGGVYMIGPRATPVINGNVIINNRAWDGGAVFVDDYASPVISNNVIVGNEATSNGAGIYVDWRSGPRIINNTIAANMLGYGGQGVFLYNLPSPTVRNNIIISQRVGVQRSSGTLVLDHNDVWNNTFNYIGVTPGEHSFSVDPQFELGVDNYHLQPGSPLVDQGTIDGAPATDFDGDPRPLGGGIDIGADEFGAITFEPDLVEAACSDPPPVTTPGAKLQITDTTNNVGLGGAGDSKTRYFFSTDDEKSADDLRLVGGRNVPPLLPGNTSTGQVTATVPRGTKSGSYWLLCCADDAGAVVEGDEENNCRTAVLPTEVQAP
jgi:parallel beta-helix repeat protein